MIVREYRPADRADLSRCFEELQNHEKSVQSNRVSPDQIREKYFNYVLDQTSKKRGKILVADEKGKVVGLICFWVEHELESDSDYLYVSDWVVLEEYRRQGIGKILMEKAQDYANQINLKSLRLGVLIDNDLAKGVYYKLGFKDYSLILAKDLT